MSKLACTEFFFKSRILTCLTYTSRRGSQHRGQTSEQEDTKARKAKLQRPRTAAQGNLATNSRQNKLIKGHARNERAPCWRMAWLNWACPNDAQSGTSAMITRDLPCSSVHHARSVVATCSLAACATRAARAAPYFVVKCLKVTSKQHVHCRNVCPGEFERRGLWSRKC